MAMTDCPCCGQMTDARNLRNCRRCGAAICAECEVEGEGLCRECRMDGEAEPTPAGAAPQPSAPALQPAKVKEKPKRGGLFGFFKK